jgi:hypothetical protein
MLQSPRNRAGFDVGRKRAHASKRRVLERENFADLAHSMEGQEVQRTVVDARKIAGNHVL